MFAIGVASIGACGASGDGSDVGSTANGGPGHGGSQSAGQGGGSGQGGAGQGGAGQGGAGQGGAGQGGAGGGGGAPCKEGEKKPGDFSCLLPCSDVAFEVCKNGAWVCAPNDCPPTGGMGGSGGSAGQGGGSGGQQGGSSGQGGGGGYGGYMGATCPANACGQACAVTTASCGGPDDPEVKALFASCPVIYQLGPAMASPLPDGTTQCCWQQYCPGGRPLYAGGEARVAGLVRRGGWA